MNSEHKIGFLATWVNFDFGGSCLIGSVWVKRVFFSLEIEPNPQLETPSHLTKQLNHSLCPFPNYQILPVLHLLHPTVLENPD